MRFTEFVAEIERLDPQDYQGGKEELKYLTNKGIKQYRPLPDGSGLLYSISNMPNGIIRIHEPRTKQTIAQLTLNTEGFPIPGAMEVDAISVDEDYRGQGLSTALYNIVLKTMKRPLVAGYAQTPGGQRNWVSIYRIPGVEVYGYVRIDNSDMDEHADTIMGQLGGDYMGPSGGYHYFRFPVKPTTTGKELTNYIKNKSINVYGEAWDTAQGGLYAVYTGQ